MTKNNIDLRHEERVRYFKERGYKYTIPQDTDGRVEIVRKLFGTQNADYDAMVMLFDPEMDANHDDMLNMMGLVYRSPEFQKYNIEKATILHLKSSELGNCAAAYNIAMNWYLGFGGPINYDMAEHWFQSAHDLGHGCAISVLEPILHAKYGDGAEVTERIDVMRAQALERDGPWAWYGEAVKRLRDPYGDDYMPDEAIDLLHEFTKGLMCPKPRGHASKILALRYYLGLGVNQDLKKAKKYLNKIPKDERDPEVRYRIQNIANKVHFLMFKRKMPKAYAEASEIIQNTYETGQFPNRMPDTPAMSDQLWAVCELAREEGWPNASQWGQFWESVQRGLIGITQDQVQKATYDFGPFYNKVDDYGLPILGAYEKPGEFLSPIGGLNSVTGVRTDINGDIEVEGIPASDDTLSFVIGEDINTAMILAFGDRSGPIYPSLSIEPFEKMTKDNLRWTFKRKVFDPEWIGHTALGKTLYATDYWLGRLAWSPWQFNRDTEGVLDPKINNQIKTLTNEMQNVGGHDDGLWSRVMLKPQFISFDWKKKSSGRFKCMVQNAKIMVDGSDAILHDDGTEDRVKNLNNVRFHTGRVANLITDRYNDVAQIFPIYERARQLMILMYAMNGLRERGFTPNKKTQSTVNEGYKHYRSLPALQLSDLVVK